MSTPYMAINMIPKVPKIERPPNSCLIQTTIVIIEKTKRKPNTSETWVQPIAEVTPKMINQMAVNKLEY